MNIPMVFVAVDVLACATVAYFLFNFQRGQSAYKRLISYIAVALLMACGLVAILGVGVLFGAKELFPYVYRASVGINVILAVPVILSRGNLSNVFKPITKWSGADRNPEEGARP